MSARHGPVLDRLELAWEPRKTILQYHKIAPKELDRIAGEYAPSDDNETYHLFDGLWHIFSGYKEAAHLHKVIPDLTDTRERLSAMLAACRKLRAHLRCYPYGHRCATAV